MSDWGDNDTEVISGKGFDSNEKYKVNDDAYQNEDDGDNNDNGYNNRRNGFGGGGRGRGGGRGGGRFGGNNRYNNDDENNDENGESNGVHPALEFVEKTKKNIPPARPKAHAWIPANPPDPESILCRLKECNPDFPTDDWKIWHLDKIVGPRRHAVFILNNQSLPHLARSHGRVDYGFHDIHMKLYKSNRPMDFKTGNPSERKSSICEDGTGTKHSGS